MKLSKGVKAKSILKTCLMEMLKNVLLIYKIVLNVEDNGLKFMKDQPKLFKLKIKIQKENGILILLIFSRN